MADFGIPEELQRQLSKFESTICNFENALKPFLGVTRKDMDQLDSLEAVQVQLGLAQSVHALFKMYLLSVGINPADHPVNHEAERLAQYSKRVAAATAAKELAGSKRSLALNIGAANRFIEHAIPELSQEQKQKLREVGRATQEEDVGAKVSTGKRGKSRGSDADAFLANVLGEHEAGAPHKRSAATVSIAGTPGSKKKKRSSKK
uniref:Nuclear nucleic acid-binding protein C1D n=1 Tax=Tetraselmis chuii TaxID=63592 RepID=A0A7S1X4P4_9CHLO|eukprot:CAMPEP_0177763670 /NCGR_PEP_ID=MMETSP0491_2-20121128/6991_1 /TAXON_ID=63592 /ORGANISM="Tetraselmis chuii, Strain PLY429" /LENGTH=204 /DNA_ID=CAMNT_0019279785 /DNA_START=86 /DNA_END=700 /DNA_ORIENTATION=+